MMSQKILKSPKKWRIGRVRRMWEFLTFLYPYEIFSIFGFGYFRISFDHLPSVTNLFKQHPSHMMSQKIVESLEQSMHESNILPPYFIN